MREISCKKCIICDSEGQIMHHNLRDRLFNTPGKWNINKCPSPKCGLLWLDPMPLEEDIHEAYKTFTTHVDVEGKKTYIRSILAMVNNGYLQLRYGYQQGVGGKMCMLLAPLALLHPGGKSEFDALSHYLPAPLKNDRLLEVGCGNGQTLSRLRELGWNAEGLEVDPVSIKIARSKGIKVTQNKLAEALFEENSFDAVLLHHVFEHIFHPANFLEECKRILKPGGRLVMVTPNADCWGHVMLGSDWYPLDPPRHIFLYSVNSMRTILNRSGFSNISCVTSARGARSYYVLSNCLKYSDKTDPYYRGGLTEKLRGILYQLAERFLMNFRPNIGEEILVICNKE